MNLKTVKKFSEYKCKEKSSIFIGQAFPTDTSERANIIINNVRKKYYDATHHCYAYKIRDKKTKFSDDGEPNGTAGIRILNAIQHFDLNNILVIVIRYFGGTKLGVGLLGKVYYNSAFNLLNDTEKIELIGYKQIKIVFSYDKTSKVHHFLTLYNAKNIVNSHQENSETTCSVKSDLIEKFVTELGNACRGNVNVQITSELIFL